MKLSGCFAGGQDVPKSYDGSPQANDRQCADGSRVPSCVSRTSLQVRGKRLRHTWRRLKFSQDHGRGLKPAIIPGGGASPRGTNDGIFVSLPWPVRVLSDRILPTALGIRRVGHGVTNYCIGVCTPATRFSSRPIRVRLRTILSTSYSGSSSCST